MRTTSIVCVRTWGRKTASDQNCSDALSRDTAEAPVKSYINEHFNDPYSVRDLEIGTPKRTFNLFGRDEPWWLIPFKCNSKNASGAYTSKKWRALPAIKKGEEWFYNYGLDSEVAWQRYSYENPERGGDTPKWVLLSLLNNGGADVAFVQNTETNQVQKVTKDPNVNNLRLVEIHRNTDPQKVED